MEKLAGEKEVKALESQRNAKRRALFDAQDDIDRRREQLIAEIEGEVAATSIADAALFYSMEVGMSLKDSYKEHRDEI